MKSKFLHYSFTVSPESSGGSFQVGGWQKKKSGVGVDERRVDSFSEVCGN